MTKNNIMYEFDFEDILNSTEQITSYNGGKIEMKKYILINICVLFFGIAILVLFQDDANLLNASIKFIGLCLTLISAFLIICYFFGITLNK